jgi:HD-GYP domain-containing protein (c-di-GMP phosphodiesterase class II)
MTQEPSGPEQVLSLVAQILATHPHFHPISSLRPHPLLLLVRHLEGGALLLIPASTWSHQRDLLQPYAARLAEGELALLLLGRPREADPQPPSRSLVAILPDDPSPEELAVAFQTGFHLLEARARAESRGKHLNRYRYELSELIEIAKALTTEREIDRLLNLILEKARFITGADAGSLYVIEGDDHDLLRRSLRFKLSQNESIQFDSREFTIPISPRSIAGSAVLHRAAINLDDVYEIPVERGFSFDPSFDRRIGYRTRSMLTAPLINHRGDVVGVLQLINKKRDPRAPLRSAEDVEAQVVPFDARSEELLLTLASQAAVALENALLYAEITALFEGFVKASVSAIEQRDPTTSGHSRRVADLTVGLARAVERETSGPYRDTRWTPQEIREIEYASLLHDFGKIGVREQVLVKAKKLHPGQLQVIRMRIDLALRSLEIDVLQRRARAVEQRAPRDEIEAIDRAFEARRAELEASWQAILVANEPTVLQGGDFARVEAVARETYPDLHGHPQPLLSHDELTCLRVPRGSLTGTEIDEIRSHVAHTRKFLSTIPWGASLRRVPLIAGAHPERLNGTGYPDRLLADQIPLQSKMMSISDIFDALTAADRPYKRAVPLDRALDILHMEVKDQHIDGDLLRIFCEARVWEPPA